MENPILLPLNEQSEEQLRARLALVSDEVTRLRQQGIELAVKASKLLRQQDTQLSAALMRVYEDSFVVHEHFMAAHEEYMALHAEFTRRRVERQTAENWPQGLFRT